MVVIPSKFGDLAAFLENGIPEAALYLSDIIDDIPGVFEPFQKPCLIGSRFYLLTKFNTLRNICRLYAIDVQRTMSQRLRVVWYQPFTCFTDIEFPVATPLVALDTILVFARGQTSNNTLFGFQDLGNSSNALFETFIPDVPASVRISSISIVGSAVLLGAANTSFLSLANEIDNSGSKPVFSALDFGGKTYYKIHILRCVYILNEDSEFIFINLMIIIR